MADACCDSLTADLTEAEQYREAYHGMFDEVDALVRKNALAEDEAAKLSKFNAQILGHNNGLFPVAVHLGEWRDRGGEWIAI